MTPSRLARLLVRILTVVVLVASGAYLLIYLYRWEWNRALISGVFFIAAEVALATASLGRRMARVEERVERLERSGSGAGSRGAADPSASSRTPVADQPEEAGTRGGPFPWLEPGSLSVFVPVLLGVGAILSGIAYLIERVATSTDAGTARSAVERRMVGLQPPASSIAVDDTPPQTHRVRGSWFGVVVTLVVATLFVWTLVIGLIELTQNRPDPIGTGGRSSFDMVIEVRGEPADVLPIAQALVTTCGPMASPWSTIEVSPLDDSTVRMDVTPSLAENAGRRFTGCLTDLQLDRVLVHLRPRPEPDPDGTVPASTPA
jgi:hypothetical protein